MNPAACLQEISQLCKYCKGKDCPISCQAGIDGRQRFSVKVKDVPYNAKQALTGGRDLALTILSFGLEWGCVVNATPRPLYPLQKDTVSIVQEVHLIM